MYFEITLQTGHIVCDKHPGKMMMSVNLQADADALCPCLQVCLRDSELVSELRRRLPDPSMHQPVWYGQVLTPRMQGERCVQIATSMIQDGYYHDGPADRLFFLNSLAHRHLLSSIRWFEDFQRKF